MGIIVQKFGGSSVADTDKLFIVCKHIIKEYENRNKVVVVVSAQGKTTDKLILEESEITSKPNKREHDVLVSTGEQITIAKLTMCLEKLGYSAISYMGWQLPIVTDSEFGNAKIKEINTKKILRDIDENNIVVIAGFQGVDEKGNITTLGRGGSDTTAVAIAATLNAERCDIFTDVDGVHSADPKIIKDVIKIDTITYDEMLELSSLGAKVLHNRCVEIGKNFNIPITVKSTFEEDDEGTIVKYQKDLEGLYISGIAKIDNISKITIMGVPDTLEETYKLFKVLSENDINVDIIAENLGDKDKKNISFSISTLDEEKTLKMLNDNLDKLQIKEILYSKNLAKVSIVDVGMANVPGVASELFEILYENDIKIYMISTSEIKISVLVEQEKADLAMRVVHNKFLK